MQIRLNPKLDPDRLRLEFQGRGRLQIRDVLVAECAETLASAFKPKLPWFLAFNRGSEGMEVPMVEIERMTPARRQHLFEGINARAGGEFQYCFLQYYISEHLRAGRHPGHPLHAAHEFLNSDAFLDFMRRVTGDPEVVYSDALASIYSAGHFLTEHDDSHSTHDRAAAYVLGLSQDWNRNWGGHLVFFDAAGNIIEGFAPSFNTLNLFRVPQAHAVQQVAAFARGVRRSITGWVHRRLPAPLEAPAAD